MTDPAPKIQISAFPGTDARLERCHGLRRAVFIVEQSVPEAEEIDGRDAECAHVLLSVDGVDVGTARLRLPDDVAYSKAERVAVAQHRRGQGLGRAMMRALEEISRDRGRLEVRLGAQLSALGFYEGLGYAAFGPVFDDAGIDHRMMKRVLAEQPPAAVE